MKYNHATEQYETVTHYPTHIEVLTHNFEEFLATNKEELLRLHSDLPVDEEDYLPIEDLATQVFTTTNRKAPIYNNIVWPK